jgi:hypothetical protein
MKRGIRAKARMKERAEEKGESGVAMVGRGVVSNFVS